MTVRMTVFLARGIVASCLCLRRLETKNRFAFFHEIEAITGDGFEISRIGLEQGHFAGLMSEQDLLLVHLRLQMVDLGAALRQLLVRWNKQTHNHEPECDDE